MTAFRGGTRSQPLGLVKRQPGVILLQTTNSGKTAFSKRNLGTPHWASLTYSLVKPPPPGDQGYPEGVLQHSERHQNKFWRTIEIINAFESKLKGRMTMINEFLYY